MAMVSSPASTNPADRFPSSDRVVPASLALLFFLVVSLFFLWGIPNNLNDILIRQFMKSFTLTRLQAGLVQSAFYLGYFLLAMPAAFLMRRRGYKAGLITGLALLSLGCLLFWPAAYVGRYSFFLTALFVMASGLAFLETASNPFIAQLGSRRTAAQRLNLAQAFNPLGAITGVFLGTRFILSGVELSASQVASMQNQGLYDAYLRMETQRVVRPYLVLGAIALLLLVAIAFQKFPVMSGEADHTPSGQADVRKLRSNWRFLSAVVAQFLYVGAQVGTWSYFIQYVQDYTHQPERTAGYLLTTTLVAFGIGRFASAAMMRKIPAARLMAVFALTNTVLFMIGVVMPGWVGLSAIWLSSFFMSLMFPTIFALGIDGLGPATKLGSSIIIMAIVGGTVLTPLMGWIATFHAIALAYLVPFSSFAFIAAFAIALLRARPHLSSSSGAAQ